MSVVLKCDLCKEAVAETMEVVEIKVGRAGEEPREVYAAHICDGCMRGLEINSFLHKFKSMGAIDLKQKELDRRVAERAREMQQGLGGIAPANAPVPVDPRLMNRIKGR